MVKIIGDNAAVDWLEESELVDIDPSTVRRYNSDIDIDFYGLEW